MTRVQVCINTC